MSSFCQKMKQKIRQLASQDKLSLSRGCSKRKEKGGKNVLDLGERYFSAGCRRHSSGTITAVREYIINSFCAELVSDYLDDQSETDQMDSSAIGKKSI